MEVEAEAETEVEMEARARVLSDAARRFATTHGLDSGGECQHDIECVTDLLAGQLESQLEGQLQAQLQRRAEDRGKCTRGWEVPTLVVSILTTLHPGPGCKVYPPAPSAPLPTNGVRCRGHNRPS